MWFKILGRVIFIVGMLWFVFLVLPIEEGGIYLALSMLIMIIGLTIEYNLPVRKPLDK